MAYLQAVIDDSTSDVGNRQLFVAGYLGSAAAWVLFSEAWERELKNLPAINYLKMAEANSLRGQFRGWTDKQRDAKLLAFARIVQQLAPSSFHVSVSRDDLERLMQPAAPRGLGSPYFMCCFCVVSMVARQLALEGSKDSVEFIFDQQNGVQDDIPLFFEYMVRSLPKSAQKLIAGIPQFRDDKTFAPLQAADMLAWHRNLPRQGDSLKLEFLAA